MDFCHSRGVYHRDLKPENLLLDESGNLRVSDFELSAVTQQLRQDGLLHTTCGTPAYVVPEVITRKGYDGAKADVWSCGVILFVLMAGYLPFHDPNMMVMYNKICKGEFKCPSCFSYDVRRLMNKLLDPNPKTWITIPQLMEAPWFRRNFKPVNFEIEDDDLVSSSFDEVSSEMSRNSSPENTPVKKPASLNAFDIISFSCGFDLSRLYEEKNIAKSEKHFTSTQSFSSISSKLEEATKLLSFNEKKTNCKIEMQGNKNSRKGTLVAAAYIFEVTPSFFIVELKKAYGDTIEYEKFCN